MPSMLSRHELSRRPRKLYSQSSMKNSQSGKLRKGSARIGNSNTSISGSGGYSSELNTMYNTDSSSTNSVGSSPQYPRVESLGEWGHFVDM